MEEMSKRKFDDLGVDSTKQVGARMEQFRAALKSKMEKYYWKPEWIILALTVFTDFTNSTNSTISDEKTDDEVDSMSRKFRPESSTDVGVYYWGAKIQELTALKLDFEKMELLWVTSLEQSNKLDKSDKSGNSHSWPVAKHLPKRHDGPNIKWDTLDYYENETSNTYRLLFQFVSDDKILDDIPLNLWFSLMEEIYRFFNVPCWSEQDFRSFVFPEFCHYYSFPQHRVSLHQQCRITAKTEAADKINSSASTDAVIWEQCLNAHSHQGKSSSAYHLDQLYAPMINHQFKTATDTMFSVLPLQEQIAGRKFIDFIGSIQNTPDSYFPHWTTKSANLKGEFSYESSIGPQFLEACHFLGDWTFGPSCPSHLRKIAASNSNAIDNVNKNKTNTCYEKGQFGWNDEEIQVRKQVFQLLRKIVKTIHYYDFCPGKLHPHFDMHVKETGISLDLCAQIILCQIICLAESASSDTPDKTPFAELDQAKLTINKDKTKAKAKNKSKTQDDCDEEFPTTDDYFSNLSDVKVPWLQLCRRRPFITLLSTLAS